MKDEQILETLQRDLGVLVENRSKCIDGKNFNAIYDFTKLIKETLVIREMVEQSIFRKND